MSAGYSDHEPGARMRGIGLMVMALALFSMLDACAKYLSPFHAISQIVFARYAVHLILTAARHLSTEGWSVLRSGNLSLQIFRSSLLLGATTLNFIALRYLQLADTASIAFTIPLWVAVLSVPLLGEHIGIHRWLAVLAGFIGVMIIVRPGAGLIHWAVFLSLAMAVCVALYQITTRMIARIDRASTTQLYTALVGTLGTFPFAIVSWTVPTSQTLGPLLALGIFGAVGHYCLIAAHHRAPAPVLAPFGYTQIFPMVAIGYLVFGDVPSIWTLLGGLVVVASGLYLLHRERLQGSASPMQTD